MPIRSQARLIHAVDHYENFPVASRLLPARQRASLIAVYRFARYADDIADEGNATPAQRLHALTALRQALLAYDSTHAIVGPVLAVIARHQLPATPFLALLEAFEQDLSVKRYADQAALEAYCQHSANPVGEIVLRLFECWHDQTRPASNAICTALQLINFLQDIGPDWLRGRLYLPQDLLSNAGVSEAALADCVADARASPALTALVADRATHARQLLFDGEQLLDRVPLRLSLELRAVLSGAHRVLHKLHRNAYDPLSKRVSLRWHDGPALLLRTCWLPRARPRDVRTTGPDRKTPS